MRHITLSTRSAWTTSIVKDEEFGTPLSEAPKFLSILPLYSLGSFDMREPMEHFNQRENRPGVESMCKTKHYGHEDRPKTDEDNNQRRRSSCSNRQSRKVLAQSEKRRYETTSTMNWHTTCICGFPGKIPIDIDETQQLTTFAKLQVITAASPLLQRIHHQNVPR